jgi:hypothetical protein
MNRIRFILICFFAVPVFVQSQSKSSDSLIQVLRNWEVVTLMNGGNTLDINGDGNEDLIFRAWRGNYNAHGFSQFSFFIHSTDSTSDDSIPMWHLVPFQDKNQNYIDNLTTIEGADCILQDIRVLRPNQSIKTPITVIVGKRGYGQSYADSENVVFKIYQLHRNDEGIPGWPPFYFEEKYSIEGKNKHCDINEAFLSEIGISRYSRESDQR